MSGLRGGVAFALAIAAKQIMAARPVGALFPPIALFVVLVTSVVMSGALPCVLRRLDLVVPCGDASSAARSALGDNLPVSAAPSFVEGEAHLALSVTGKEAGTSSAVAIVHARGRDSVSPPEDERIGLISRDGGVVIGSAGETLKRASPRIASTASPERGRGHGGSVQNVAFQLGRVPDPRWQEGAHNAAVASMRMVSLAAAAATKSFQAAADVVLVRQGEVGTVLDVAEVVDALQASGSQPTDEAFRSTGRTSSALPLAGV